MHNSIDKQHCNSHKTIILIIIIILTVIITITTVINFNRYLLKRLNTLFEKLLVLRFTTYY